jgi:deazaflavin-dependent oxidoreductase (nitroreductase family)
MVSITQRLGGLVVATFAVAFARAPWLIRVLNPVMRRLLVTRLPAGPNVLLTVRGRRSGLPHTTPVAFLDLGERCLLQASSDEVDWVRNLRASGAAVISRGGREERFEAAELAPEAAGHVQRELLAPFPRSRLIRAVVGPVDRPPVAVLHYFRVRVDDALDEYIAVASRQPLFELRRPKSGG